MFKITQAARAFKSVMKSWFGSGSQTVIMQNGQPRLMGSERAQLDNNTIIQACLVSILSALVSTAFVSATETGDGTAQYDYKSRFSELLRRPNPAQKLSGKRLLKAMGASYVLDGNAYCEVQVDRAGDAVALWWIPHWACTPIAKREDSGQLSHYEIALANGSRKILAPEYVIHIADGIDPVNPLKGRSPVKCLLLQVMSDNEADAYTAEIIRNPAVASWAFIPKNDKNGEGIDPASAQDVQNKINTKFGPGGRGGVFVPSLDGTIQTIGFSPEQLALDKLRRLPEARISAVLDVPAIIAGLQVGLERSTFSNTEEARKYFIRYRIAPLWEVFEEEFTEQLMERCSPADGERAAFDTRKVIELHEPLSDVWARYGKAWELDMIKLGEARKGLGYTTEDAEAKLYRRDVVPTPVTTAEPKSPKALQERLKSRRRAFEANGLGDGEDEE